MSRKLNCPKDKPKNFTETFKCCKKNTIHSLNEVEYFLNNFGKALKCLNLYKFFK